MHTKKNLEPAFNNLAESESNLDFLKRVLSLAWARFSLRVLEGLQLHKIYGVDVQSLSACSQVPAKLPSQTITKAAEPGVQFH